MRRRGLKAQGRCNFIKENDIEREKGPIQKVGKRNKQEKQSTKKPRKRKEHELYPLAKR
jgi:hypothetical protein